MESENYYLMDRSIQPYNNKKQKKYIAKSYDNNGNIQYFDENEPEDGFNHIIKDLEQRKHTILYTSQKRMKATLEFLNELKFSVKNTTLILKFRDEQNVKRDITHVF